MTRAKHHMFHLVRPVGGFPGSSPGRTRNARPNLIRSEPMTTPMTDTDQRPALDVRPLAYALTRMIPGLYAVILPGERWDDMRARRDAAADILDDLLAEAAYAGAVA